VLIFSIAGIGDQPLPCLNCEAIIYDSEDSFLDLSQTISSFANFLGFFSLYKH
jgi:hypothetical protein